MSETKAAARREFAVEVVRRLRSNGFQALFAGGCVRDLLLGIEPSDYDVATDARPERVRPLFRRVREVGASFGVVRVIGPPAAGDVEIATFRSDGAYLDGRRPESVVFSGPEEDAARRDFTINGMFYDPLSDQVIDFVGGRADLEARLLRAIGDPSARFDEDKLRLLRAARFAARFGLEIERGTYDAVRERAADVAVVAVERIAQELRKMLAHPTRAAGVRLMADLRLLPTILPSVAELESIPALWFRMIHALALLPEPAGFPLALACMLQHVGKLGFDGEDHPARAAKRAELECRRLKLSNDETERTVRLVENHRELTEIRWMKGSRLKPLLASPWIDDLIVLHEANGELASARIARNHLASPPDGPIDPPPLLGGDDLKGMGLKPGPKFARYLKEIRRAQLDRELNTREEALAWVAEREKSGE